MPLHYAASHVRSDKPRSRASVWGGIVLTLLFVASATLCFHAIRWDRWASYEGNDRRWYKNLPGESYASYKSWYAWRKSWERGSLAAAISGAGLAAAGGLPALSRFRGHPPSRWLLLATLLHGLIIGYFVVCWGPDFRHPYPRWTG